jgi:hypothetical protein
MVALDARPWAERNSGSSCRAVFHCFSLFFFFFIRSLDTAIHSESACGDASLREDPRADVSLTAHAAPAQRGVLRRKCVA